MKIWSKSDFKISGFASICLQWHEVVRVNAKSLTVTYPRHLAPMMQRDDLN